MPYLVVLFLSFFLLGTSASHALFEDKELCKIYENIFIGGNKSIAQISVDGVGDNSAVRENSRQLKALNERIVQLITIEQMKAHNCKIPKTTSREGHFLAEALECSTAKTKADTERIEAQIRLRDRTPLGKAVPKSKISASAKRQINEKCNMSKWTGKKEK